MKKILLGKITKLERKSADLKTHSNCPYVSLEDIDSETGNVTIAEREKPKSSKYLFSDEHVLYGKLRPYLRKVARPAFKGICSTDIVPILPLSGLNKDYLYHFLRTDRVTALASKLSVGVNLPRLSPKQLSTFEIPLPTFNSQKRIAKILDAADALRAKRRESLTLLDDLTQSIFLDMFGDPVTNPMGWEDSQNLGDMAEIVSGITKGRKVKEGVILREVPYLAVANVQDRYLKLYPIKTIAATETEIQKYSLRGGDLLLTEGGDPDKLGRGSLWDNEIKECIHQNHVFRVRLKTEDTEPVFLNWLLGSERGKQYFLRSAKQTTGIASINMTQLKAFPMLIPPLHLQQRFASIVESIEKQKERLKAQLSQMDTLFASLQQRAFQGQL